MRHRKIRSWLTILGVVIGIAAIISLVSVGEGMEHAITKQFDKMGTNRITLAPKGLRGPPVGMEGLTDNDAEVAARVNGVDYVTAMLIKNEQVVFGSDKKQARIVGFPSKNIQKRFSDMDTTFKEGGSFASSDKYSALVGKDIAKDFFDKDIVLRNSVSIGGKKFRIVGLFDEIGVPLFDGSIFIPLDTARDLFDEPKMISSAWVYLKPGVNIDNVAKSMAKKLKRSRDDENFEVYTPKQLMGQVGEILSIVRFILAGIAAISLLVGGIGIMNAMFTAVLERTREIGVMKAVGATNMNIVTLFLVESGMIGLLGGVLGVGFGYGMSFLVEIIATQLGFPFISIEINWLLVIFSLGFAFVVGVLSGTIPAFRAAKLKPVDALRYL